MLADFLGCHCSYLDLLTPRTGFWFALFVGIFFQCFSIVPVSSEWSPKSRICATKADFLSLDWLDCLLGWMAVFQIETFQHWLGMTLVSCRWMMQISHCVSSRDRSWLIIDWFVFWPLNYKPFDFLRYWARTGSMGPAPDACDSQVELSLVIQVGISLCIHAIKD